MSDAPSTTNSRMGEIEHSITSKISFAVMMFGFNAMAIVVTQQYPFFYESLIGLSIEMMFVASIFYTVWDMLNDPAVGHFSDRNNRFTRRWGKRLPWIAGCIIPLLIALFLLFFPPSIDILGGFLTVIWFLIFLSAYDGLLSAILVNYNALLPVKFKSKEERRSTGAWVYLFMMLGPFLGLGVVAQLSQNTESYALMSLILGLFVLISFLLSLPGLMEEEWLKDSYFQEEIAQRPFFEELSGNIRLAFQSKPFVALAVVTLCVTVSLALINASQPYYVSDILGIQDPDSTEFGQTIMMIALPFVLTTTVLIPLYAFIIKKIGHAKALKYSLFLGPLPVLLIFVSLILGDEGSVPLVMLGAAGWGVVGGLYVIARVPVQGDFFDSSAVEYHRRQEGMYLGVWNFFARMVTVIQIGTLWFIHTLTSFDAKATTQTDLAKWGIMAHFGLVPAILMTIAALIFWKYWDITPEKMEPIKKELEKLGI